MRMSRRKHQFSFFADCTESVMVAIAPNSKKVYADTLSKPYK